MTWLAMIRHGPTEWNAEGRIQGHTDVALSVAGIRQLQGCAPPAALVGFDCLSSPLRRTLQTARLLGCEPQPAAELIEMCWGRWEGARLSELRERYGGAMQALEDRGLDFCPPGGESPRMVQQRLMPWFARVARVGRPTLAVSHKGVIRATMALALNWDMTGRMPVRVDWSAFHLFRLSANGIPILVQANIAARANAELIL